MIKLRRLLLWKVDGICGIIVLALALVIAIVAFIRIAWVGDDAFITFRTLDNFVNGYGLRWNISERVQSFTNPLWLFIHAPFYFFWRDAYHLTIIISLICSLTSIAIVAYTFKKSPFVTACFLITPLLLSQLWVEFGVSGLENPLSYLLFAIFGWISVCYKNTDRWFWLSFIVALAMLNRLDVVLIYIPPMVWLACKEWRILKWRYAIMGMVPLLAWLAFSLVYYGFVFPNTKYAKLNTGIQEHLYIMQGFRYLQDLVEAHGLSTMIILSGIVFGWLHSSNKQNADRGLMLSVMLGMLAYIFYIVSVGGDFMSGRFFSMPVLISMWLVYAMAPTHIALVRGATIVFLLFFMSQLNNAYSLSWRKCSECIINGIADERERYNDRILQPPPSITSLTPTPTIKVLERIGWAYADGPSVYIVDTMALSEPLLARLPVADKEKWRIGHFERLVPDGYLVALKTGSTAQMEPNLAHYYEKLRLITRGNLWDWERFKIIIAFNLGKYDHWIESYVREQLKQTNNRGNLKELKIYN
jgi:arabinofuranosyltransferase